MADVPEEPRAKRARVDKGGRFAALAKLKELKGSKHKYEVEKEVDNVYEVVDEREYAKKAKEKYGDDWIEDDGTGYAEDGRDFFEDEDDYSDDEPAARSSKKDKKGARKRPRDGISNPAKKKGSIRSLFNNAVPKKAAAVSLAEDDILAGILGEMNEDSAPLATSTQKVIAPARIVSAVASKKPNAVAVAKEYMNSFISNIKIKERKKKGEDTSDDELIDRILKPKPTETNQKSTTTEEPKKLLPSPRKERESHENPTEKAVAPPLAPSTEKPDFDASLEAAIFANEPTDIDFSCLHAEENQFDVEQPKTAQPNGPATAEPVAKIAEDDVEKLLQNWESICQMDNFEEELQSANTFTAASFEATVPVRENLRFWCWEAWEDTSRCPGMVFLFGRTADGKSICVRVENVENVLHLLPREFMLDPITKEPTRQKVTLVDLYKEFDEDISVELRLTGFRSRKVTKNFANHSIGVDVPQVCDYMEVHYDGKRPPLKLRKKYNSIAHVFGANTTSLERFLLDRKIKGPCWLTLKQFQINTSPLSWCKVDINVSDTRHVIHAEDPKPQPPPPLTLMTIKVRTSLHPKTLKNEICMISVLVHNRFHIDRPAPNPAFNRHMCGFTRLSTHAWPFDLAPKMAKFNGTRLFKHDTERALLSWFLAQYQHIDADLIVAHDAIDCQLDVLTERIAYFKIPQWSRLGRLHLTQLFGKRWLDFFAGRMVCDVKTSAEECIRSRSFDLQTLCQTVLKVKENERMDVNEEDLQEFYESSDGILKLITLTMQDASYILRLMCELNIMPLALQLTNICGNTMTRTLLRGRSERNEFLLLHAFNEKNFIVPDKKKREWGDQNGTMVESDVTAGGARKKAAYAGGLVLEPIKGLYDKYVLLLDFNSLYPSIIQEYNICFTTVQQPYYAADLATLPPPTAEQGILPQQLRRLVESRREVKKLMAAPDLSPELQMQYSIRQMALKLTANSMYGCLGFANSRFYAQHLAALVTHKGREILMNTKSVVQKMNFDVVYGDTDSIMVNTNITDYDQVFKIGHSIKQSINKMYKQLELDIDGVFSVLLLLKKKKYAAVKVSKTAKGELKKEQEHKGLDIVRRDWSQLAIMVGKVVLDEILSEKQLDEKLDAVHAHLEKIRDDIKAGQVPVQLFIITKQLSKAPNEFKNIGAQSHVQVALRMNTTRKRRYKKGDMVDYVICEDGTGSPASQRAYHLDELKSNEALKLDTRYYLAHQIHPVVARMVDVLEGTDASRIADCLGLDPTKFRAAAQRSQQERSAVATGESLAKTSVQKYRECEKFKFVCIGCKTENVVASAFRPSASRGYDPVLLKCDNPECSAPPYQYIILIRNQLQLAMRKYVKRFYQNWLVCDDPACNQNTRSYTHVTSSNRPVCRFCRNGSLVRQYSERDLYNQLSYFQYMFDLSRHQQKNVTLTPEVETAYSVLRETVDRQLEKSAYCTISMAKLFAHFKTLDQSDRIDRNKTDITPLVPVAYSLDDV